MNEKYVLRKKEKNCEIIWQKNQPEAIFPIFLPFMGCKRRCIFCAQDIQIGITPQPEEIEAQFKRAEMQLINHTQKYGIPTKIAFYGGTFTALTDELWGKCLNFAIRLQNMRLIDSFVCSTRPDALTEKRVEELREAGCTRVELGIQTLDEKALYESGRTYASNDVKKCIQLLKNAKIECGAQLMPGFPFTDNDSFFAALKQCLEWNIKIYRIYPCIVFKNTSLAQLYLAGHYKPLSLEEAIQQTAHAWEIIEKSGGKVIRMGILMTGKDKEQILAGPHDEAFGSRVMSKVMLSKIREALTRIKINSDFKLFVPSFCQGFFWGWKGELREQWLRLNVKDNLHFWDKSLIKIIYS